MSEHQEPTPDPGFVGPADVEADVETDAGAGAPEPRADDSERNSDTSSWNEREEPLALGRGSDNPPPPDPDSHRDGSEIDSDELSQANTELTAGEEDPETTAHVEAELTTEQVIESILFASDAPLTLPKIVSILGVGSARDVRKHIESLNARYERAGASFRIENVAGGYQMLTRPEFNTWVRRLKQSRQDSKLSQAALETLAVVAYKQPVVRVDIEAIRGVASGEMLNRLRELGLIKIVGRAEDVGRPMLYGTTKRFLEVFGLSDLKDLPEVEELQPGE